MNAHTKGPWKVAATFQENQPVMHGVYAPASNVQHFNGELVALCPKESNARVLALLPDLTKALGDIQRCANDGNIPPSKRLKLIDDLASVPLYRIGQIIAA